MILPNGKYLEVSEDFKVLDEITQGLTPQLATIARRAFMLHDYAYPLASNLSQHGNYGRPIRFARNPQPATSPETGTTVFRIGEETARRHKFLWITLAEDRSLTIVHDYQTAPTASHLTEVEAKSPKGQDYTTFAINVFKRLWNGGAQGPLRGDLLTHSYNEVSHRLDEMSAAIGVAEGLSHQTASRLRGLMTT